MFIASQKFSKVITMVTFPSPVTLWETYLPKRRQHKQTGSRQDKTVLSEHSTT